MVSVQDARDAQERMVGTIRDNPVPFALIGVGLGVLMAVSMRSMVGGGRGFSTQEPTVFTGPSGRYGGYGATSEYTAEEEYESPAQRGHGGNGKARSRWARERLQRMQERTGGMARQWRGRAGRAAETAQEQLSSVRHRAGDYADRSARAFEDRPLIAGAAAFLLGAAVGAMLPRSRREEEFYGAAREGAGDIGEQVGHITRETLERVRTAAEETARTVGDEARAAGERLSEETRRPTEQGPSGIPT